MAKLIVVLVLTDQLAFTVAVETHDGLVVMTIPNTESAADGFFSFVTPIVEREKFPYQVCIIHVGEGEYGFIGQQLVAEGIQPHLLASAVYREYAVSAGLDPASPATAARACIDVFKVLGPQRF
jgi:hypothetical protein